MSEVQDSEKNDEAAGQLALVHDDEPDLAAKKARLEELEQGIKSRYIEIGLALEEIRVKELYRVRGLTWEQYTRQRWDISSRHANRLRAAARFAEEIGPTGPVPRTERGVRPLVTRPRSSKKGSGSSRDFIKALNANLRGEPSLPTAITKGTQLAVDLFGAIERMLSSALQVEVDGERGVWIPAPAWRLFYVYLPKRLRDVAMSNPPKPKPGKALVKYVVTERGEK